MSTTKHTVGVERLRNIPGNERAHHAITAVVERHGSHMKVCVVSAPVSQYGSRYSGMTALRRPGQTVAALMDDLARGVASTYGATHVPAVTR